ncbi:MAG: phosphate ABC transporter ATP-binding protein, partial [Verrucomicrobiota bacterium]|nr:phosphate ABC transporter ATP-binding protein [Verrucomicrobiota bacterium]
THNLAQARRLADDVAVLWVQEDAGRLIESGSARQVFEAPRHELTKAYITGQRG